MMIFNLKTANAKKLKMKPVDGLLNQDKALEKQRKQYKYQNDGSLPRQKQLEQLRNQGKHNDSGQLITEKTLKQKQTGSPQSPTQHQLDNSKKVFNLKRSQDGKHPSRFSKQFELQTQKQNKKQKTVTKQRYMDSIQGQQLIGQPKKIIKNNMHSQLFSNYDSEQDFRKSNPSIKKSQAKLVQADAKLYFIFRTAAEQGRELNSEQNNLVGLLNDEKAGLLSNIVVDIQPSELFSEQSNPSSDQKQICKCECPCHNNPIQTMQIADIDEGQINPDDIDHEIFGQFNELNQKIHGDDFGGSEKKQKSMAAPHDQNQHLISNGFLDRETHVDDEQFILRDQMGNPIDQNGNLIDDEIVRQVQPQQFWNPHDDTFSSI